jgi:hypothetical protein
VAEIVSLDPPPKRAGLAIRPARIDMVVAIAASILFIVIEAAFQYHHVLGEDDLYRVMVGVMDGIDTGRFLNSPMHYLRDFGFGYLAALYAFVPPDVLRDPDRLMPVMNQVGIWSLIVALPCLWMAVRLAHGALVATVALIVFTFSPMMLELGTSGHQVLPMLAFLAAAAVCMFLPLRSWGAVVAGVAATILLLCGFLCRGEIFLGFPWLVLTRIDGRSFGAFVRSGILRSIPPLASIALFLVLHESLLESQVGGAVGHYFFNFYAWATMIPGLVYMAVGCGIATTGLALLAALWLLASRRGLIELLGPLALTIVPMAFFLPNPQPTRHFMLTLLGFGILLGMALARSPALRARGIAYTAVLVLVLANHALSEAIRPALLRENDARSPLIRTPEAYRTTTQANVGWFWKRHATLVERRERWQAMGDQLLTSCESHTLLLSDAGPIVFSRLYAGGAQVTAEPFELGRFIEGRLGVRGGKHFLVLRKENGWPEDAVAAILADHQLDDYKIEQDPLTMSRYDRTAIPPDRRAHFGCASGR